MISIEKFGVFQFVSAEDAGVNGVPICVPLHGRCMEDIGQVQVLLPRDVGQVSLGFVNSLSQTQLPKVFLQKLLERKSELLNIKDLET